MKEALVDSVKIAPPTQNKKERNSSVELFRILATFLVLITHLNGWMAGGFVDWNDPVIGLDHKVCQLIIASLTVVCVNCFLIISGWYGLKLKFSSVWKMWVMLVCIYVPFYFLGLYMGNTFSPVALVNKVVAFSCESYFIQNYLMLMFLSPALNAFIEKYKDKVTSYAISLFVIEVLMESIFQNKSLFIENGYSLIHFITMYMLARSASFHKDQILKVAKYRWLLGYFLCAAVVCALHFTPYKHTWGYSNPVVVIESFMLFFPFLYKQYSNRFINWVAGGALAVYVIQVTNPVCDKLFDLDQWTLINFDYTSYLPLLLCFSLVFFIICLLYNEIAHRILGPLLKPIELFINDRLRF